MLKEGQNHAVFVYGTLLEGASNHHRLEGSDFIGKAKISGELFVIDWYPGVRLLKNEERWVYGEVYKISNTQLQELDCFEGPEYCRQTVSLTIDGKTLSVFVWEYIESLDHREQIHSGNWLEHPASKRKG